MSIWLIINNSVLKSWLRIFHWCKCNTKQELWEGELLKTQNHGFWFTFILKNPKFIFKKIFPPLVTPMSSASSLDVKSNIKSKETWGNGMIMSHIFFPNLLQIKMFHEKSIAQNSVNKITLVYSFLNFLVKPKWKSTKNVSVTFNVCENRRKWRFYTIIFFSFVGKNTDFNWQEIIFCSWKHDSISTMFPYYK